MPSEQPRFTFRFVDLEEFKEFLERDDVQEKIREIAREIKREPREQIFGIKRDKPSGGVVRYPSLNLFGTRPISVGDTIAPNETALAEIADLRRRLERTMEAWRVDKAELESLRRRAEEAEAEVEDWRAGVQEDPLLVKELETSNERGDSWKLKAEDWRRRCENADAAVETVNKLADRLEAELAEVSAELHPLRALRNRVFSLEKFNRYEPSLTDLVKSMKELKELALVARNKAGVCS